MAFYLIPGTSAEGSVKSVQRGTFTGSGSSGGNTTINVSAINPAKSVVIIDSGAKTSANGEMYPAILFALTATTIIIRDSNNYLYGQGTYGAVSSWQLIEYI